MRLMRTPSFEMRFQNVTGASQVLLLMVQPMALVTAGFGWEPETRQRWHFPHTWQ